MTYIADDYPREAFLYWLRVWDAEWRWQQHVLDMMEAQMPEEGDTVH